MPDQFDDADRMIERTASAIVKQVAALLRRTARYESVDPNYVVERLIVEVFQNYPEAMAWLDRQRGEGSMRLSEALKDWLDLWERR
jgi:hypothetical protein